MKIKCSATGCESDAGGAIAVELYPYEGLMRFYKEDRPLSRMVTTLAVCDAHLPPNVAAMFSVEDLKRFVSVIEAMSGVSVDPDGCKLVLVPFTNPDYLRLLEEKRP